MQIDEAQQQLLVDDARERLLMDRSTLKNTAIDALHSLIDDEEDLCAQDLIWVSEDSSHSYFPKPPSASTIMKARELLKPGVDLSTLDEETREQTAMIRHLTKNVWELTQAEEEYLDGLVSYEHAKYHATGALAIESLPPDDIMAPYIETLLNSQYVDDEQEALWTIQHISKTIYESMSDTLDVPLQKMNKEEAWRFKLMKRVYDQTHEEGTSGQNFVRVLEKTLIDEGQNPNALFVAVDERYATTLDEPVDESDLTLAKRALQFNPKVRQPVEYAMAIYFTECEYIECCIDAMLIKPETLSAANDNGPKTSIEVTSSSKRNAEMYARSLRQDLVKLYHESGLAGAHDSEERVRFIDRAIEHAKEEVLGKGVARA